MCTILVWICDHNSGNIHLGSSTDESNNETRDTTDVPWNNPMAVLTTTTTEAIELQAHPHLLSMLPTPHRRSRSDNDDRRRVNVVDCDAIDDGHIKRNTPVAHPIGIPADPEPSSIDGDDDRINTFHKGDTHNDHTENWKTTMTTSPTAIGNKTDDIRSVVVIQRNKVHRVGQQRGNGKKKRDRQITRIHIETSEHDGDS